MKVSVSGKQIQLGEAFRTHAEEQINVTFSKYFDHAQNVNVVMSHDGPLYRADISVLVGHVIDFQGHGEASEIHPAFDLALERTAKQMRRQKRKLRDHHRGESDKAIELDAE
jgi:ribosomal subunit interface protein